MNGLHPSIEDKGTGVYPTNLNHMFKPLFATEVGAM
jgi:hypothetical protein